MSMSPHTIKKSRRQKTHSSTSKLLACHELGRQILKHIEQAKGPFKRLVVSKLVMKWGRRESELRRALQLARTFSASELAEFSGLRRTIDGQPLDLTIAFRLMHLSSRRERMDLARDAARHGWSTAQVEAERKRRFGVDAKARKGGRRPRTIASPEAAVLHLADRAARLVRFTRHIDREPGLREMPRAVRAAIHKTSQSLQELVGQIRGSFDRSPQ